jgi:DNA polymerase-4
MQKVIFLVDMNAFFISCEMTRNPELSGKPAAVAGDPKNRSGIILAANYEARKYGVKTTMVLHQVRKLCPEILLVPPDHAFYERKSQEVMHLLSRYSPVIEQNSIDEAWLDMTGCESLFGSPLQSSRMIMDEIKDKLGLMCSIGIAENKFLAKMASEMKKPMGITELWEKDIPKKMWPLPVGDMYGVGKQTAEKLSQLGIETIGQLAHFNVEVLKDKFGKGGPEIHQLANGKDFSEVMPHTDNEMKSIGRSTTLISDVADIDTAEKVLFQLADEVGTTARKHDKKGHTVQITIKYSDFKTITRQVKVPATYLTKEIYAAGTSLLRQNWSRNKPVRLLGISISGFEEDSEADQISMFEVQDKKKDAKEEKLERAVDRIREKHGSSVIKPAILFHNTMDGKD